MLQNFVCDILILLERIIPKFMHSITFFTILYSVISAMFFSVLAFFLGIKYRKHNAEAKIGSAEEEAKRIMNNAIKKSETATKEAIIEAKDELFKLRTETEKELKERRLEVQKQEKRLQQKEESIEKKLTNLESKDDALQQKIKQTEDKLQEAEQFRKQQIEMLEKISGLTTQKAKDYILALLDQDLMHEKVLRINEYMQNVKEESENIARNIISQAIQRYAADQVAETTVSVVVLPSDEMKGRIIGREGRNIRALETLAGVDLIIDDTPETITISCTEPIRREIARVTLEKLILDGRIHPGRIEEMFNKATREIDHQIKRAGESAVLDMGLNGVNTELIKLLGRLRYRTSYGQNVLIHSMEVANLAGLMAAELGEDVTTAKRAGLLHDIGKALSHEMEGSHVQLGVDVARKYKESDEVIHAIEAHHGDVESKTVIASLVQAADAISAARPGARKENIENFIKRLEKLENIANSFPGVEKSYAIQAGREIRIIVRPDEVSDDEMVLMARDIVKQIEQDLNYPGQIKIHVIRESRAIEYAK